MVLINQVPTQSPSDWEVQCENQLQQLGLSGGSVLLKCMRSHRGVSSPEYEDDSKALSKLIRQNVLIGNFTLGFGDLHGVDTLFNRTS